MNYKTCIASIISVTLLVLHGNGRAMDEGGVKTKSNVLIPLGVTGGLFFSQYVWGKTIGSKEKKSFYERVKQCEKQIAGLRNWHNKNDAITDAITFVYSPGKKRGSFQGSSELANKFVQALNYLEGLRAPGGQMELGEKLVKDLSEKITTFSSFLYSKKIPTKLREHEDLMEKTPLFEKNLVELEKDFRAKSSLFKSKLAVIRSEFGMEITKLENGQAELKKELKDLKEQRNSDDESDE